MTRVTMKVKKQHHEASKFDAAPLPTKSELLKTNNNSPQAKIPVLNSQNSRIAKSRGKFGPDRNRDKNVVCFGCRAKGHSLKNCTQVQDTAPICYHCGSDEHITKRCPTPGSTFPFATCFVCNKRGHLSSKCPQNTKGLYPNGGGCRFCGSVNHLARDCKPTLDSEIAGTVGKIDAAQGGDDDDVFITLKKIEDERAANKLNRQADKNSFSSSSKPVRKVVRF